jgi:hypothetical protein
MHAKFTIHPEALELAGLLRPEWSAKLHALRASGVPLNDGDSALMPRVRELNQTIAQDRATAGQLWNEFETARDTLATSDKATDQDAPEFQAAEAASRAYEEAAERIRTAEEARDRLLAMVSGEAPPSGNGNGNGPQDGDRDRQTTVADTLLESVRRSAGSLALQSDDYKRLQETNAFTQAGRKSIEAVLIRAGGEEGREQLKHALLGGSTINAALVTGVDDAQAGSLIVPQRLPGITVPFQTRPLRLVDMITVGQTDSDSVSYVEMTGFTNAAAETAEATATSGTSGTKPESALALALRETAVRTIAHWIPSTKRALSDAGQLRTLIEGILGLGLDLRLDQQIVSGDGVGENLRGIRNATNKGLVTLRKPNITDTNVPESILDTIHRAITAVRLAFFEPTAVGIHPTDWERVRLARSMAPGAANAPGGAGTAPTGDYLMGDPTSSGVERVWGLLPVVSPAFAQGHPVIGDYRQAVLWLREGTQVSASDSHMDFFIRNMVAILAEFRAAFGVLAGPAFCEADIT